jgi:predicted anti-sigma-YlaC factor YlaD
MLRHCTIAELLEVRDGEGSANARAHLVECNACRAELDRLHQRVAALKALPGFSPPRDRWPVIKEAIAASRRRTKIERVGWVVLAAAAAVVLVVGTRSLIAGGGEGLAAQEVAALVQESQQLEEVLQGVSTRGRVTNGATAATIADLEDRIALIDFGIERAQAVAVSRNEMADLWRERVTLMDRLVDTHVRQVRYVGY